MKGMFSKRMTYQIKLEKYRADLDELDTEIIELLGKRFEITEDIGKLKSEYHQPVYQAERETKIIDNLSKKLKENNHRNEIIETYKCIFKISREAQNQCKNR